MTTRPKYWLHISSTNQATSQVNTAVSPQTARNFGLADPQTRRRGMSVAVITDAFFGPAESSNRVRGWSTRRAAWGRRHEMTGRIGAPSLGVHCTNDKRRKIDLSGWRGRSTFCCVVCRSLDGNGRTPLGHVVSSSLRPPRVGTWSLLKLMPRRGGRSVGGGRWA